MSSPMPWFPSMPAGAPDTLSWPEVVVSVRAGVGICRAVCLTFAQREEMAILHSQGQLMRAIGATLGRAASTVCPESCDELVRSVVGCQGFSGP